MQRTTTPATDAAALADTLERFAEVFSHADTHSALGQYLACSEADALAALLTLAGRADAAQSLIGHHGRSDEPDENHYRQPVRAGECTPKASDPDHVK